MRTKYTKRQMQTRDADGNYPIHIAAREDRPRIVSAMLDAGADINAKGDYGRTPLMCAADAGAAKTVRLLIKRGADLERRGNGKTAFLYAARSGSVECVRLLFEAGADIRATTTVGQSAVSIAYGARNTNTLLYLLDIGSPKGNYDFPPRKWSLATLRKDVEKLRREGHNRREIAIEAKSGGP